MTKERIEKAVKVIKYAIQHNISVQAASIKNGYAGTYVKNIKAVLLEKYESNSIEDELFSFFMDAYGEYEKKYRGTDISVDNDKVIVGKKPEDLPNQPVNNQLKHTVEGGLANIEYSSHSNEEDENIPEEEENYDDYYDNGRNYPPNHIKSVEDLLDACEVDQEIWQVKDYLVNKWDVTSWRHGYAKTVENFQVKARLERIPELHKAKVAAKIFQEMTENYTPPKFGELPRTAPELSDLSNENNLLEISIFDLHLGKLGWAGETGENFDSKIAAKRFMYSIKTLIYRAMGFKLSKVLFLVGQDFFNSDNKENTTSNGTPQDEDLRWQKTFDVGCRLLVDGITLLKEIGIPIEVLVVPGNHDFERSFYVGKFLEGWFNSDHQVVVNNGASPRKYFVHGEVLLGFTHGRDEKQDSLPLLMASDKESKPHWSNTTYHEWHLGHVHRKKNFKYTVLDKNKIVDEDLGVTVRYLSSLTGTEEWHHKKGFIGQIKAAEAFVWNDKSGLIAHLNSNLLEQ